MRPSVGFKKLDAPDSRLKKIEGRRVSTPWQRSTSFAREVTVLSNAKVHRIDDKEQSDTFLRKAREIEDDEERSAADLC